MKPSRLGCATVFQRVSDTLIGGVASSFVVIILHLIFLFWDPNEEISL